MAAALFRNATHGPGFISAPKPYVWERIEPNQVFELDRYPGAWAEAVNDEAAAIIETAVAAKKRKGTHAEGPSNNLAVIKPPTSGMAAHPAVETLPSARLAHEGGETPVRPAPRRRAAKTV